MSLKSCVRLIPASNEAVHSMKTFTGLHFLKLENHGSMLFVKKVVKKYGIKVVVRIYLYS